MKVIKLTESFVALKVAKIQLFKCFLYVLWQTPAFQRF